MISSICPRELGALLAGLRNHRNEELSSLGQRYETLALSRKGDDDWELFLKWLFPKSQPSRSSLETTLGQLERGKRRSKGSLEQVLPLTEIYRISPLMFCPLAGAIATGAVHQVIQNDFRQPTIQDPPEGSTYLFPEKRLEDCDAFIVNLKLAPKASSESHWHVGEELIFVVKGTIEIHLEDNGVRTRDLQKGDYFHFCAHQRHTVSNSGDCLAELFIIRFDQLTGGFRANVRDALSRSLTLLNSKCPKKEANPLEWERKRIKDARREMDSVRLWLEGELHDFRNDARQEKTDRSPFPEYVENPAGLAGFIDHLNAAEKHTVTQLHKTSIERDIPFTDAQLRNLLGGHLRSVKLEVLDQLAQLYAIPEILFYPYLFPRIHDFVAVRRHEDLVPLPEQSLTKQKYPGALYQLPCRTLAATQISTTYLSLDSGAFTAWNKHPGFELILPISGQALVETKLQSDPIQVSDSPAAYAMFSSNEDHRLCNNSNEVAKLFVVRVYGSLPTGST